MLSFNAAYERLEPPCSNGYETLVCRYTNGSYRSDQGYLSERVRGNHSGGRVPGTKVGHPRSIMVGILPA